MTLRRGPRKELSDDQLHNRRDQLVQLFEADWARIGLALQRCKEPDDLIGVFSPLLGSYASEVFSIFCHPSKEIATGATLRKIRRELRALVEPRYAVDESKHRARQQLQEIKLALTDAQKASRRIVRREQKKVGKVVWRAEQESRVLLGKEKEFRDRLRNLEASFARQEIFRFVKSERYELNPLSLANAVANLPYSGWRQSMKRNGKAPSKIGNGLAYQVFKAIRFLTTAANKQSVTTIVTDFRARIRLLPSRHSLARMELSKNWYFLKRAIGQGYKREKSPDALHFAITELYLKHLHSATRVDMVAAGREKIELSRRSIGPARHSG